MKLCRFDDDRLGLVEEDTLVDVSAALACLPAIRWPYPAGDAVIAGWAALKPEIARIAPTAPRRALAGAHLRSPVANPGKIIGRAGTDIAEADAMGHIFGYSIGLDMSLRGPEPASARKSIDSYAVLGPWIATADEIADPDAIATRLYVDGEILQEANTSQLAFGIRAIVAHASTYFTLYPGDVIMAGTAASFAPIHPGSVMVADFESIGRMEVAVRAHV